MEEDCRVTRCKRKASISHVSPRKRQRGDSEPTTEVAVEAVTDKGTKRKASTETQMPSENVKFHSKKLLDTSEPTEVSQCQGEASAEQQPAAGSTRMKRRRISSRPSTATENNWSKFLSAKTSRGELMV